MIFQKISKNFEFFSNLGYPTWAFLHREGPKWLDLGQNTLLLKLKILIFLDFHAYIESEWHRWSKKLFWEILNTFWRKSQKHLIFGQPGVPYVGIFTQRRPKMAWFRRKYANFEAQNFDFFRISCLYRIWVAQVVKKIVLRNFKYFLKKNPKIFDFWQA